MVRFEKAHYPPAALRADYLNSLAEPQELYLQALVETGETLLLDDYAYAVVCDGRLVEFYVAPPQADRIVEIFKAVMKVSGASTVLAKSYDTQLLFAAFADKASVHSVGLLFRRIVDKSFVPRDEVAFRQGTAADAMSIYAFNDEFFESVEEIQEYAALDGLFVLEQEGETIGCGIGKPVIEKRPDIDIGMLVSMPYRRKGYGAHIIAYLKNYYLNQGLRPICGCSIDNVGSQRALRNAGFVSEHRVLEISY